ncbi:phosphoglucomutase/phosphomannomutase family protein [Meiothermus granaticius]|uniref:Phosphoglucomutase n=1 Tax=Meiothermus granaticius NBRC 107808 TaxID=1227551 RepID=A0A399F641_9DEIN|nr:phosphoglucomutase/phosphomannomutase family protein [Meiothermus granaticius]MCL6525840.1 phosphoglucomutase/phosphomannomutase family protein [Thermaceae bacterium]RIH92227.1 Phosphoglucomutase [Meiothermus granaticius NBRC 107808]GEM85596.1 phosphohexose mutase [Meiothermus granaticius NBRC 107808]
MAIHSSDPAALRLSAAGWRGVIGEEFTFANLGDLAQAYASALLEQGAKRAVVGYDTRFMAGKFARHAAHILAANGLEVHLSKSPLPTPVLSYAVRQLQADGGMMVTAGQRPPEYLGLEFKGPQGERAGSTLMSEMEKRLGRPVQTDPSAPIHPFDLRKPYYDALMHQLDLEALRGYEGVMYHDSLGGAGAGWLAGFVKHAGLRLELRELHAVPDPMFYGVKPEPTPPNEFTVMTVLKAEEGQTFAAVTDGDAGGVGAVLAGGAALGSHQVFAVLLAHLLRKGWRGAVVQGVGGSGLIERLAGARGLEYMTLSAGSKPLSAALLEPGVLIGGEASGRIAVARHLPEPDGLYTALLLLESLVVSGKGLGEQVAELEAEAGFRSYYQHLELQFPTLEQLQRGMRQARSPKPLAGLTVVSQDTPDGIQWGLEGKGWLLLCPSNTEPLLQVYAEAQDEITLRALLQEAKALMGA